MSKELREYDFSRYQEAALGEILDDKIADEVGGMIFKAGENDWGDVHYPNCVKQFAPHFPNTLGDYWYLRPSSALVQAKAAAEVTKPFLSVLKQMHWVDWEAVDRDENLTVSPAVVCEYIDRYQQMTGREVGIYTNANVLMRAARKWGRDAVLKIPACTSKFWVANYRYRWNNVVVQDGMLMPDPKFDKPFVPEWWPLAPIAWQISQTARSAGINNRKSGVDLNIILDKQGMRAGDMGTVESAWDDVLDEMIADQKEHVADLETLRGKMG